MNHDLSGAPAPTPLEKKRFLAIQLMRLTGAALVILGVLIAGGKSICRCWSAMCSCWSGWSMSSSCRACSPGAGARRRHETLLRRSDN